MSIIAAKVNAEIFSCIPELGDALQEFKVRRVFEYLTELGNIFTKHNAHDDFGLSLVHRHFDVSPGEILVETINEDTTLSVMMPWTCTGDSCAPQSMATLTSYDVAAKKFVVPINWCFSSSGKLEPFEFLSTDEENNPTLTPDFAKDVFTTLKKMGMEKLLGIRRVTKKTSWETTPSGLRANISVYGPENVNPQEMVQVGWQYYKNGNLRAGGRMCGGCDVWCDCGYY